MKFCALLIGASLYAFVPQANADDATKIDAALDFYTHSQLVITKSAVNPFELAGCLVLHKDGQTDQYINVLPESIKKTLKPENLTGTTYRTMMTKDQAVKVGFLVAFGISTSEKSMLEISINARWKMEGPSFWNDNELKKIVLDIGKIYLSQGYKIFYNQNVQYSILASSNFEENSGNVTASFTYVDAGGKQFVQSSDYSQRELIAISPFDIGPILVAYNPTVTTSANFVISKPQIENILSASRDKGTAIKLDSADFSILRKNVKSLSSVEFKNKVMQ